MNIDINQHSYTEEDFLKTLLFFKNANYNQKVEFMTKYWGKISIETTIRYKNGHNITINIGEDKKYHYTFDVKELNVAALEEICPDYYNALVALNEEDVIKAFPEIDSIDYIEPEQEINSEIKSEESNTLDTLNYKYLSMYNKIDIKYKNKEEN